MLWLVLPVGVLAGAVSAIAGFGVGSLLTPLLTPLFGAKLCGGDCVDSPHDPPLSSGCGGSGPTSRCVGALLHDRLIGALELCCRRGEMLLIQNKRVNWETCQIGIPGATAKDKENRRVPFNPHGRVAAILKRRSALGPDAFVFGTDQGAYQENIQTAWETLRLLAHDIKPKSGKDGAAWNRVQLHQIRPSLARPQTRGSLPAARGWRRHSDHPADARSREHSADPALSQCDRRRTAARTGGELEARRPTASTGDRKLIGLLGLTACLQSVSTRSIFWLRGLATAATCRCGTGQLEPHRPYFTEISCSRL